MRLGDSLVVFDGPWTFAPGDSPRADAKFIWASPAFDDSGWTGMDLRSRAGQADLAYENTGYIEGWTVRGFPRLTGYAWYRLRVHLSASSPAASLKMPDHVDDAYQVFANGQYLGQFGDFRSQGVVCFRSRPLVFTLPAPDASGNLEIAVRFYMEPWVLLQGSGPESGGMRQAPILGRPAAIESVRAQEVTGRIDTVLVGLFVALFSFMAAAIAFRLWMSDRMHTTYLWLTLALLAGSLSVPTFAVGLFTYLYSQDALSFVQHALDAVGSFCWIMFWRHWFGLRQNRRLTGLMMGLLGITLFCSVFINFVGLNEPLSLVRGALYIADVTVIGLALLLFLTLLQGARKDRTGALLALSPVLLFIVGAFYIQLLDYFHLRTVFFPFGVQLGAGDVANVLLVLIVGVLVSRRFVATQLSQRLERQTIEQDLERARELQQHVLVPEPIHSSVFKVESAYLPARIVGGDFYQTILHPDGSLLIVVGDVSGKGVAAAMLVAVLVGAIRTRADETSDPTRILGTLNERLLGRSGGHFATCIAARLTPDGGMQIANAGHLPPYRNGKAIDLPGSLPLGLSPEADYVKQSFQLDATDHITFLTDGVLEARNARGELLGFERMNALAVLAPDEIARAAIAFGQDDDITVLSVTLQAVPVPAELAFTT